MRARKRRINCESELLERDPPQPGPAGPDCKHGIHFLEEVDYKMEVGNEMEERHFVALPDMSREMQIRQAFKKKQCGALQNLDSGYLQENNLIWR